MHYAETDSTPSPFSRIKLVTTYATAHVHIFLFFVLKKIILVAIASPHIRKPCRIYMMNRIHY